MLVLSLLKDTTSILYQISSQIREIFVHQYNPPYAPMDAPANKLGAASLAPAPIKAPVFKVIPAKNGESEIEIDEAMSGPRRIEVQIVKGRNLPKMDQFGTIDGYCDVTFNKSKVHTTKTQKNTYSPDWAENFEFLVDDVSQKPAEGLKVVLMDWDRMSKNERVGEVFVSADRIWDILRTRSNWQEERDRQVIENAKPVIGNNKLGSVITIRLKSLDPNQAQADAWKLKLLQAEIARQAEVQKQAETHKQVKLGAGVPAPHSAPAPAPPPPPPVRSAKGPRVLEFTVVRGLHLPKMDRFNTIDAYCEVKFGSHPQQRTDTKKNTYTPVWNQPFTYAIPDVSVRPAPIVVSVFDWNAMGQNDLVGTIEITPDHVWDILQRDLHDEETLELRIIGETGREVTGFDQGRATIYFKVKVTDPSQDAPRLSTSSSRRQSQARDDRAEGPRRIELTLIRGQHLPKLDTLGSIDPFCEIRFGQQVYTSNHVKGSYTPVWNEPFMLYLHDVSKVPGPVEVSLLDWNRLGKNTRVGGFEITSDEIWDASRMSIGWEMEKDWPVVNDRGGKVMGNDNSQATISLRLRLMDAGIEQRAEMQRTHSKLASAPPPPPPAPLVPQPSAVKTYKLGASAGAHSNYDQVPMDQDAQARALWQQQQQLQQQQWELDQARLAHYHNQQFVQPQESQFQNPDQHPVFEHEHIFRKNHDHVKKSCHEMESLLNSIRVVKSNG
jgi:hypothetical protein